MLFCKNAFRFTKVLELSLSKIVEMPVVRCGWSKPDFFSFPFFQLSVYTAVHVILWKRLHSYKEL